MNVDQPTTEEPISMAWKRDSGWHHSTTSVIIEFRYVTDRPWTTLEPGVLSHLLGEEFRTVSVSALSGTAPEIPWTFFHSSDDSRRVGIYPFRILVGFDNPQEVPHEDVLSFSLDAWEMGHKIFQPESLERLGMLQQHALQFEVDESRTLSLDHVIGVRPFVGPGIEGGRAAFDLTVKLGFLEDTPPSMTQIHVWVDDPDLDESLFRLRFDVDYGTLVPDTADREFVQSWMTHAHGRTTNAIDGMLVGNLRSNFTIKAKDVQDE